jgi:hypothetical protein
MLRKIKNSISVLVVLALLTPPLVRLEHHHEPFFCNAKQEKHFHTYHEKCLVCNFEFSAFSVTGNVILIASHAFWANYILPRPDSFIPFWTKFSFLLRAPPVLYTFV